MAMLPTSKQDNSTKEIISTKVFRINNDFLNQRKELINEAIAFESGTIARQKKTVVATLPNGKEAYFLKPGKETLRKIPNPYDMSPNVGSGNKSDTENWAFEQIWEYLLKISIIQQAAFKKVLVLLYRLCFFIDHQINAESKLRYSPSYAILKYIGSIDEFVLKDGFMEKFKTTEIGLPEFLYFVELLAWNEDVKYHTVNGKADFTERKPRAGRVNTAPTIISTPLLIGKFINNIIDSAKPNHIINVRLITDTIQQFVRTRGLCVLSGKQLLEELEPYLVRE
ncbi:MAG: hypothetical protein MdMp024_0428 [Bacteroidales bacterium]